MFLFQSKRDPPELKFINVSNVSLSHVLCIQQVMTTVNDKIRPSNTLADKVFQIHYPAVGTAYKAGDCVIMIIVIGCIIITMLQMLWVCQL